ncbi:MAG: radical SAM protein [Deltaproteobacteria bacterium]|nr:MAG: radical SAM protein [Deltaproteobacteria bacterium]
MKLKKSSNLLLINPWIYDFAAYDFWAKPLGFLYLASLLKKNGYNISFIDCLNSDHPKLKSQRNISTLVKRKNGKGKFFKTKIEKPEPLKSIPRNYSRYGITPEIFEEELKKIPTPEAILVTSTMTYWYPGVFNVIKIAKSFFPHIPIILGGIYVTLCYSHAKKYSGADFVISGDSQLEVLKLISSLTGKETIFFPNKKNLDSLPYPAFDLLGKLHYVCILTSRGCPYQCQYCASHILSPHYFFRDPKAVADEIEFWNQKFGILNFAFYDDALLFQPERRFIPLLKEIICRRIHCCFHTPNGINIRGISEEIAYLMFQSGFRTIRLGLETANENQMIKMGGKATRKEFINAVEYLRKAGFSEKEIGVYLLVGLPGQRAEEVEESIQFVKDCGARPYLAEYSPIPGTQLWEKAVKFSAFDLVNEPLFHNNSILPCAWEKLTRDDLDRLKQLLK